MKTVFLQVEYKKDLENTKGHSINFCDTPQFQNAAKVAQFTSDVSDLFDIIRRVCTALARMLICHHRSTCS